jgi:beta-lactamase class A
MKHIYLNNILVFLFLIVITSIISCSKDKITRDKIMSESQVENVKSKIEKFISSKQGDYAIAYKDIQNGNIIFINENEIFHAASTMKTPVMIEIFKQAEQSKFSINDSIVVYNNFKSIVDGSEFSTAKEDDSDTEIYNLIGSNLTINELIHRMITVSSNLATNLLIELVDAKNVTQTMRELGAKQIQVLRGVEDMKAFRAGLNNSTTAYDLLVIFEHLAKKDFLTQQSHDNIIDILLIQKLNQKISAKLPQEIKVANKTGFINNVEHDSGIIFLPDGRKYILIMLSRNLSSNEAGIETLAEISKMIYEEIYLN